MEKEEKTMLAYKGMALNEEQMSALKKVEDSLNELGKLGVQLVLNLDTNDFIAVSTKHLGAYDYNYIYDVPEKELDEKVVLEPFDFDKYGTKLYSSTLYVPAWDFVMLVDDMKTE